MLTKAQRDECRNRSFGDVIKEISQITKQNNSISFIHARMSTVARSELGPGYNTCVIYPLMIPFLIMATMFLILHLAYFPWHWFTSRLLTPSCQAES